SSSPQSSTSTTIAVSYTAADSGSGLQKVELWAQAPGDTAFTRVATDSSPAGGSFGYTAAAGDGSYAFYTVAVDKAGNREDAPAGADATTRLDTSVPSSSASAPAYGTSASITVSYTASDLGSGLEKVELWAQAPGETSFAKVATDSS